MNYQEDGRKTTRRAIPRLTPRFLRGTVAAAIVLAAASAWAFGFASTHASAGPTQGGTVTSAIVGSSPSYIFPLTPPADSNGSNIVGLQDLLYVPLYVLTDKLDDSASLADLPVYSNHDTTVTIHLKKYTWSDGQPVTSRDVAFFLNLAKANKTDWNDYVPGKFPDNVIKFDTPSPSIIVLHLDRSYDPTWFTDEQLVDVTALPQHVMDKTSDAGAIGDNDETASGAQAVYTYLAAAAKDTSTYASNPLWQVVDGPWKLQSFAIAGPDVFVPNPRYSPQPHISQYVETSYTSDSAEFNALLAGTQIDIGQLPPEDLGDFSQLKANYQLTQAPFWHIGFVSLNYRNPITGPIVSQLYIRQALQHLMNETGVVRAFLDNGKAGYADYGPMPPKPASVYQSAAQKTDPYPYSIGAARRLLVAHGWKVPSSGAASCVRPGTAANECGSGIPAGRLLKFNFVYASGESFLQNEVADYQSNAAKAGVVFNVSDAPFATVITSLEACLGTSPCSASTWQVGTWNSGGYNLGFSSPYATGEVFASFTDFKNSKFLSLLSATESSPTPLKAIHAYDTFMTRILPEIWAPLTYELFVVNKNLHGVKFPPSAYENTTDWYFSK